MSSRPSSSPTNMAAPLCDTRPVLCDTTPPRATVPLLVLGWGNLSRGDDALGPAFVAALQARLPAAWHAQMEFLDDYQLQIEHALDLQGRQAVLFVDASLRCAAPFEAHPVQARRDTSYTSHALSPQALLQLFEDVQGQAPPPATLLAIRGEAFELGEAMSLSAHTHLEAAMAWALVWVRDTLTGDGVTASTR